MSHDLPWHTAAALLLAVCLIVGGVIAFIAGLIREEKRRLRELPPFDASVGKDCYREMVRK